MEPACYAALTLVLSKWYLMFSQPDFFEPPEDVYWNASCVCFLILNYLKKFVNKSEIKQDN